MSYIRGRYAYSEDAAEDFDKDDTNLTIMKPSKADDDDDDEEESRLLRGSDGEDSNVEEDKTE